MTDKNNIPTEQASPTPGPWRVGEMFAHGRIEIRSEKWYVACATGGIPIPEIEANARLIAAAPDMLFALKHVRRLWAKDDTCEETRLVDEAIAKAEGRSRV